MNELLMNIFFYVGYATCLLLLIALFITVAYYIFLFLGGIKNIYKVLMRKSLDKYLKGMSNESLDKMIAKIKKQHQEVNNIK